MIQLLSKDGQASQHRQRFIAFRQPAGQVNKMGRKIALPALPYSRLTALRSLLSVALSSARLLDSITLAFFHTKWSRFQFQNGPVFDFNFNLVSYQLGSFSLLKWARFHLQKTVRSSVPKSCSFEPTCAPNESMIVNREPIDV